MSAWFYPKFALDGIRKNKRLYFPYILTGSVMVMMCYILGYLTDSDAVAGMRGGATIQAILPLGVGVIGFFSLLFLFYTNSFLIRQRYREFGLYSVLGMDKRNIGRIMVWENLFVAAASVLSGGVLGAALSKAAELVLLNLLREEVTYELSLDLGRFWQTLCIFGAIYLLILFNSLLRVKRSRPLELMKNDRVGEKAPKGNIFFAAAGAVCLAAAYYIAVTIKAPLQALAYFFFAVILVIAATYMLFIAGSVVFCRILQKNKRYYYRPNHFVSVSSMVYRMKRNGAGLASICILLTMVLVMITSTATLYFGIEDSVSSMYPDGVNVSVQVRGPEGLSGGYVQGLRALAEEYGGEKTGFHDYRDAMVPGLFTEDGIVIDYESYTGFDVSDYGSVGYLVVIPLQDYNLLTGEERTLGEGECMIYCKGTDFDGQTFAVENCEPYRVAEKLDSFINIGEYDAVGSPLICLVPDDFDSFIGPAADMENRQGEPLVTFEWRCGFDAAGAEAELDAADRIRNALREKTAGEGQSGQIDSFSSVSREDCRNNFFQMYGSLFFLGIMLSIVFLLAAVLIIYYKQISEGYEDRSRFEIMQKVGMTERDIKKNVNSQILTVFFLPLVFAGIHLAFAFPLVWRLIQLFMVNNFNLALAVNALCFVAFGLFYAFVYKLTSGSYYAIVSGGRKT